MFKITSNANMVAFRLNRSLTAKKKGIKKAVDNTLKQIHRDAKANVGSIRNKEIDALQDAIEIDLKNKLVGVDKYKAPYAPFVEFGTKTGFLNKPPRQELRPIASKFKGTKPDWDDLIDRLKRGGVNNPKAYARKLVREGTTPEPFFYRAVFANKKYLRNQLKKALRKRL